MLAPQNDYICAKENHDKTNGFNDLPDDEELKKRVLEELCHIAFDDIKNYLIFYTDSDGIPKVDLKDSSDIDTRNIAEITQSKGSFKFKLYGKDNAITRLGNYLGLWKSKANGDMEDLSELKDMLTIEPESEN